jgi:hypothetical protein
MVVEASLRSKYLYKIQLYLIKVIPMVMAFISLLNTIFSYYDIDLPILSYIGGYSLLTIVFLYLSSYVFRFCEYHRMFIHYSVANWVLNIYDTYIGVPLNDRNLLILYLVITGIFLFIILHLYVKSHKKPTGKDSR